MSPHVYADVIFRYSLSAASPTDVPPAPALAEEKVYFGLQVPVRTRARLSDWSERTRRNLAEFGGELLAGYLDRFEHDPRDLRMVHWLATRLDEVELLSDCDLERAFGLYDASMGVRLPPGYLVKWLHARLRGLVERVDRNGQVVALTPQLIEEIWGRVRGNADNQPQRGPASKST
ncbi:MAG: hypothetical protein U1G07_08645 [Verrucomicrobiota bacterium]